MENRFFLPQPASLILSCPLPFLDLHLFPWMLSQITASSVPPPSPTTLSFSQTKTHSGVGPMNSRATLAADDPTCIVAHVYCRCELPADLTPLELSNLGKRDILRSWPTNACTRSVCCAHSKPFRELQRDCHQKRGTKHSVYLIKFARIRGANMAPLFMAFTQTRVTTPCTKSNAVHIICRARFSLLETLNLLTFQRHSSMLHL